MIQPVLTWEFTPLTVHKSVIPAPVFARSFVGYTSVNSHGISSVTTEQAPNKHRASTERTLKIGEGRANFVLTKKGPVDYTGPDQLYCLGIILMPVNFLARF